MFDFISYLYKCAIFTYGEKKSLEGEIQLAPDIPLKILKILAESKEKIFGIARSFELPVEEEPKSVSPHPDDDFQDYW